MRAALDSIRAACVPFAGLGAGAFHPVTIRPSLGFALVPRPREKPEAGESEAVQAGREKRRIAAVLAGGGGPPPGLVDGAESDAAPGQIAKRQGLTGFRALAARRIEDLCALVREDRASYGLWTVTLTPQVAAAMDRDPEALPRFQDHLRRRFGELLARQARRATLRHRFRVPDHWLFVVEAQKAGVPHWHFVFRCRANRKAPWMITTAQLDALIVNAVWQAVGMVLDPKAAGNVQVLRKDPGSYLSKYLRKGARLNGPAYIREQGWTDNLIPHAWWGCSKSIRNLLMRYTFEMPSLAASWLSLRWRELMATGICKATIWQPESEGAPQMLVGKWRSCADLEAGLAYLLHLANDAYDTGRTFGTT